MMPETICASETERTMFDPSPEEIAERAAALRTRLAALGVRDHAVRSRAGLTGDSLPNKAILIRISENERQSLNESARSQEMTLQALVMRLIREHLYHPSNPSES